MTALNTMVKKCAGLIDTRDVSEWESNFLRSIADLVGLKGVVDPASIDAQTRTMAAVFIQNIHYRNSAVNNAWTGWKARAGAAPVAQGDESEREAFEAWIKKDCGDLSTFGSGQSIHYRNSAVNNAWTGWKARSQAKEGGA